MFLDSFLITLTVAAISALLYPSVRAIYSMMKIVDTPSWRKKKTELIPLGGGMILVLSFILGIIAVKIYFPDQIEFHPIFYLGIFVCFITGTIDDSFDLRASVKFFIQLILALVTINAFDLRLYVFDGLFGVEFLPEYLSWTLTVIYFLVFINMFNLIDGIDGLAVAVSLVGLAFLSGTMIVENNIGFYTMILILIGSMTVLLVNNFKHDKMFLGDAGSLTLGYVMAVFILIAISRADEVMPLSDYARYAPIYAMCIFWYPLFDVVRVMVFRLLDGRSPFSPDRRHLHHLLVDRGYSHLTATITVVLTTLFITILSFYLSWFMQVNFSPVAAINLTFFVMLGVCWIVAYLFFVGWPINLMPPKTNLKKRI